MPDEQSTDEGACAPEGGAWLGIKDVSDMTGISAFTIRYYDKCGFFPNLARAKRGVRRFSRDDVEQLHLVDALRKSGLSIEGIQYFVRLQKRGSATRGERLSIVKSQETVLEYHIAELQVCLDRLRFAGAKLAENERPRA